MRILFLLVAGVGLAFGAQEPVKEGPSPVKDGLKNVSKEGRSRLILKLRNRPIEEVWPEVKKRYPEIKVTIDPGENSLRLTLNGHDEQEVRELVKQMDVKPDPQWTVFYLENLEATEAARLLGQLGSKAKLVPNPTQNSLMVSGTEREVEVIEALLSEIDKKAPFPKPVAPVAAPGAGAVSQSLPDAYFRLSESVANASQSGDREELQRAVQAEFDARQKLQLAQIQTLRQKLALFEQRLSNYSKFKDQMIQNRVNALLADPSLSRRKMSSASSEVSVASPPRSAPKAAANKELYKVQPGDTLGVFIENILGASGSAPPIHTDPTGVRPPAMGYPMMVRADGTISLPRIGSVKIAGLTLDGVEARLEHLLLRPDRYLRILNGVEGRLANEYSEAERVMVSLIRRAGDVMPSSRRLPTESVRPASLQSSKIEAGDTLGLIIENVLGTKDETPPIHTDPTGQRPPVMGYPIQVRTDGTITLPYLGKHKVVGLTLGEVEVSLAQAFVENDILQDGKAVIMASMIRKAKAKNAGVAAQPVDVKRVSLNFKDAPWGEVLKSVAEAGGWNLDVHDMVPGKLTHTSDGQLAADQAVDILNGHLLRRGFLIVQNQGHLIVWAIESGLPPSLVSEATPEELLTKYANVDNQLLTVSFKVDGDPKILAREIDVMLDPYPFVRIAALTGAKKLIITDLSSNLRRVQKLVAATEGADTPSNSGTASPVRILRTPSDFAEKADELRRSIGQAESMLPSDSVRPVPGETTLAGIRDSGKKFVYVIDHSGSMLGERMAFARAQLNSSLNVLQPDQQFGVLFYNTTVTSLQLRAGDGTRMYAANERNVARAIDEIRAVAPNGGTQHYPALKKAIGLRPDVIFFVTDGHDTPLKDREAIRKLNDGRSRIHCIEFGKGKGSPISSNSWLRAVASENGGHYKYVDVTQTPLTVTNSPDAGLANGGEGNVSSLQNQLELLASEYALQIKLLKLGLVSAETRLKNADSDFARARELSEQGVIASSELQRVSKAQASSEQLVSELEAMLETYDTQVLRDKLGRRKKSKAVARDDAQGEWSSFGVDDVKQGTAAQVDSIEKLLRRAIASLASVKEELAFTERMYKRGYTAKPELDSRQAAVTSAEARVASLKKLFEEYQSSITQLKKGRATAQEKEGVEGQGEAGTGSEAAK